MGKSKEPNPKLTPISTITRKSITDCSGEERPWNGLTPYRIVTKTPVTKGPILKDTIAETGR